MTKRVVIDDPIDYLKLRGKKLKTLLLSTLVIGSLSLPLWNKLEQLEVGQQRVTSYTRVSHTRRPEVILSVTVFLTTGNSLTRDTTLPGWNPNNNWVDVIGGGGSGGNCPILLPAAGGGGGGGYARYNNMGALPSTVSYTVGAGGVNTNGGSTNFNSGAVNATGGGIGSTSGSGGAGGVGNAGSVGYTGGTGGAGGQYGGGGGGGGSAGPNGNGIAGAPAPSGNNNGGDGGYADAYYGGAGGTGGTIPGAGNLPPTVGGNGGEYGSGVGCGGGGGGAANLPPGVGATGGAYGGGGGGGGYMYNTTGPGGAGYRGLITITYVPLPAPTVSTCTPDFGPVVGGTPLTITGTGFVSITGVTIGGVAATTVVTVNANTITCTAPTHAAGLVNIVVTNSGGSGTGTNLYRYMAPYTEFNIPMLGF